MKTKLSPKQKQVLEVLRTYNCIIMCNGWVTGGHGYKCDGRSVRALENNGLVSGGRLTDLGRKIEL